MKKFIIALLILIITATYTSAYSIYNTAGQDWCREQTYRAYIVFESKAEYESHKATMKNLEVGFWYFARLLNDEYYGKKYSIENIEDAYLAYNCGPKYYRDHKYKLKNGKYQGYNYGAGDRWDMIANLWAA